MKKIVYTITFSIVLLLSLIFDTHLKLYTSQARRQIRSANPIHSDRGKPSRVVRRLFRVYQSFQFGRADSFVVGSMAKFINNMKIYILHASISKLKKLRAQYRRLKEIRIYNEFIKGKYATVNSLWIYNAPPNSSYYYKVKDMLFLLVKKNNKWYIQGGVPQGEHILHNIERMRRIQRAARQNQRSRSNSNRTRTRRYYRRR